MRSFPLAALLLLLFAGCTSTKPRPLDRSPGCTSSLEGTFSSPAFWTGHTPALVLKNSHRAEVLRGTIVDVTDEGVVFDQDRISPFVDPPARLYPVGTYAAAVDDSGRVVSGHLPPETASVLGVELHLLPVTASKARTKKVRLHPNRPFAYCMEPGLYRLSAVHFIDQTGNIDGARVGVQTNVFVRPDAANYLGTVALNDGLSAGYYLDMRPVAIARPRRSVIAAQFGLIGALANALTWPSGFVGVHRLRFEHDLDYQSSTGLPVHHLSVEFTRGSKPENRSSK